MPEKDLREEPISSPPGDSSPPSGEGSAELAPQRLWFQIPVSSLAISSALSLVILLIGLDATMVSVSTPKITTALGGLDDVGWFGSAYFLAAAASQLAFGALNRVAPHKQVYVLGLIIFELGCLVSGVAKSSTVCVVGRALSGLGCSGVISTSMVLVTEVIPPNRLPIIMALIGAMELIGQLIGPIVGGALTARVTWRWCFLINVPPGVVCGIVVVFLLRAPTPPWRETWARVKTIDLIGLLTMMPSSVLILFVIQTGGIDYAWDSPLIISLLVVGVILFAGFVFCEYRRGDGALVPFNIMQNRNIPFAALFAVCNNAAVAIYDYYIPLWDQAVRKDSASSAGVLLLPLNAASAVSVVVGGAIASAVGRVNPVMLAGSTFASITSGLLSVIKVSTDSANMLGYATLAGVGAMATQIPIVVAHNSVSSKLSPSAISLMLFSNMVGSSISLAIAQAVFLNHLKRALRSVKGVDSSVIIAGGATELHNLVSPAKLPQVLHAYNKSLTSTFYINLGAAGIMFVCGLVIQWKRTGVAPKV